MRNDSTEEVPRELRLLDLLPAAVLHLRDGRVEWANQAAYKLIGAPPGALSGYDAFSLVEPRDLERVQARSEARQRGEAPDVYEVDAVRFDGRRVRVEIEPRALAEGETVLLLRDMGGSASDRALLTALSEVAAEVQRQRTQADAVRAALAGLRGLGFQVAAFRLEGDYARVEAVEIGPELKALMETSLGAELPGLMLPVPLMPMVQRMLREERALYFDDVAPILRNVSAASGSTAPSGAEARLREAKVAKLVLAPVALSSPPWGFLAVAAQRLRSNDAAAISLFATQFASAMESVASIERLEHQNEKLEALHAVAMLGAGEPLEDLSPTMLRIITEATHSDAAGLYLLDAEVNELVLSGTWMYEGPLNQAFVRVPLEGSTIGEAARTMTPRAMPAEDWPEPGHSLLVEAGFLELAIVPLVVNGRLGGVVNLVRHDARTYTEDDLRSAAMVAAQIALQVERSRLYAEAQSRVEQLSLINEVGALVNQHLDLDQVLSTAMRNVSRIVEVPNTFLMLLTPDGRALKVAATNQPDASTATLTIPMESATSATETIRQRRPVVIEDLQKEAQAGRTPSAFGHKAVLAVPLLSEGRAVGAIVLGETRGTRKFKQAEIERAVAVANQVASAIENARLYEEQRQRVEQLKVLLDISRLITGSLELQQILTATAESLVRMVDATDSFIWFLEDNVIEGVTASSPEHREHFATVRIPLVEPSSPAAAILTRAPARFEDAAASPEVNQALNARYGLKSLLAIPLMLRGVPIGAISIGDRRRKRAFTDDEVERALLIARQLAVAIDNARLFEDLKRSYHELSRAQKELVRRERLVALGELSAVVAHEVRNPLGVIFNSLSSLKRAMPTAEGEVDDARMLLGIVGEEAERLNRMVSDLLDFARPNEAQLRLEPMDVVVQGAIEAAAQAFPAPRVKVRAELSPALPPVPVDAHMLRQALVNLVVNAAQAMPRGGTVTVRTRVDARPDGTFARLEVEDDGPGIPPDLADRVFQPFFTTKAAGTGLGLAVVKRIADAHRADLSVKSTPGHGATFTLMLPLSS